MKYIYFDESSLFLLMIFKDENLSCQWISICIYNNWQFECNTKGWINNVHELQWLYQIFELSTREKVNEKSYLLICDRYDSHIIASWIIHCIKNIIFMILSSRFSHLIQSLNVEVFDSLKTLMISIIESFISIELYHILKIEWLFAYIEAHDNVFSIQNIQVDFHDIEILPFNSSKILNHVKSVIQKFIEIRDSIFIEIIIFFKDSVLTSFSLNTNETCSVNAILLTEITIDDSLFISIWNYVQYVIRRSELPHVRNIIIEEKYAKLKTTMIKRKTILSDKRKVIDDILTRSEILIDLIDAKKKTKKRKTMGAKKGKKVGRWGWRGV